MIAFITIIEIVNFKYIENLVVLYRLNLDIFNKNIRIYFLKKYF
jgi:hypothetical protein